MLSNVTQSCEKTKSNDETQIEICINHFEALAITGRFLLKNVFQQILHKPLIVLKALFLSLSVKSIFFYII